MKVEENVYRSVMGVFIATAVILSVPLLAMQVTDEVVWTAFDFAFAGALLAGGGLAYVVVMAARRGASAAYRWAVGLTVGTAIFLVTAMGAVGIIGSEDNPANLMYFGVLAVAVAGSFVARFQPDGMARALFATALAQALVTLIALAVGLAGTAQGGAVEIVAVNGLYIALWGGAAVLFRAAARERPAGRAAGGDGGRSGSGAAMT